MLRTELGGEEMKFFIGQAVTGENIDELRVELGRVYKVLEDKGHSSYDTLRENQEKFEGNNTKREIMEHAFRKIDDSDVFFAIIRSDRKSEGLLMEIGYCLSNNKEILLAVKSDVKNTYLRELANRVIEYDNSDGLVKQLMEVDL